MRPDLKEFFSGNEIQESYDRSKVSLTMSCVNGIGKASIPRVRLGLKSGNSQKSFSKNILALPQWLLY